MIHCMAGELGLDVYVLSLSKAGLDDSTLSELVNQLPESCIALMEDIDAAFTHGVSRDAPPASSTPSSGSEEAVKATPAAAASAPESKSRYDTKPRFTNRS